MRGEAEGKLSAGGMSHDDEAIGIELKPGMVQADKLVGRADILEGSGPAAAGVADAAVFRVEGGDACGS